MKRFLFALAGGLALVVVSGHAVAGPRVEADPNKLYPITPEVGPWVVCAASYMGENARDLAKQVVFQLRRRDNLPAYFYDYSEQERKKLAEYLKDRPASRRGHVRIQDQCGVLIGGYPDADTARKALTDVKKLKMPDLPDRFFDATLDGKGRIQRLNPFANAFVTRNPTVAHEQLSKKDEFEYLKRLNANEDFSLLRNPHPLTLAIKDFPGMSVIQPGGASPSILEKLWGNNKKDVLGASGGTAHNLAETLRKLGLEAYVLHARHTSYVTIGGFDSKDDPRLEQTRQKLEQFRATNIRAAQGKDLLQLYAMFQPMRVPKP